MRRGAADWGRFGWVHCILALCAFSVIGYHYVQRRERRDSVHLGDWEKLQRAEKEIQELRQQLSRAGSCPGTARTVGGRTRDEYMRLWSVVGAWPGCCSCAGGCGVSGCAVADPIAYLLRTRFELTSERALLLDLGANVGQFSSLLVELWGRRTARAPFQMHNIWTPPGEERTGCLDVNPHWGKADIVAVELVPAIHDVLRRRAEADGWRKAGFRSLSIGVGEKVGVSSIRDVSVPPGTGRPREDVQFYDQDSAAVTGKRGRKKKWTTQNVTTVDRLVADLGFSGNVFYMHIDAEGRDAEVLRGAVGLLSRGAVDFLDFEYHHLWSDRESLAQTTSFLWGHGYQCFLIAFRAQPDPKRPVAPEQTRWPYSPSESLTLFPLWDTWWDKAYEVRRWSNVFCAHHRHSALTDSIARWFATDINFWSAANWKGKR